VIAPGAPGLIKSLQTAAKLLKLNQYALDPVARVAERAAARAGASPPARQWPTPH
jgi:hypothetical protein